MIKVIPELFLNFYLRLVLTFSKIALRNPSPGPLTPAQHILSFNFLLTQPEFIRTFVAFLL